MPQYLNPIYWGALLGNPPERLNDIVRPSRARGGGGRCAMTQPRKPALEPGMQELLGDEIGRLVMRADHVERHEVEALVMRVKAPRAGRASRTLGPHKT